MSLFRANEKIVGFSCFVPFLEQAGSCGGCGEAWEGGLAKPGQRATTVLSSRYQTIQLFFLPLTLISAHMGPEDPSNRKRIPIIFLMPNFRKLQDDSKNVSLKIGSKQPQKLGPFFSLFLMRKTLSSGQKWFLRPYFPLIRGMFLVRSGLIFSFRALKRPY